MDHMIILMILLSLLLSIIISIYYSSTCVLGRKSKLPAFCRFLVDTLRLVDVLLVLIIEGYESLAKQQRQPPSTRASSSCPAGSPTGTTPNTAPGGTGTGTSGGTGTGSAAGAAAATAVAGAAAATAGAGAGEVTPSAVRRPIPAGDARRLIDAIRNKDTEALIDSVESGGMPLTCPIYPPMLYLLCTLPSL